LFKESQRYIGGENKGNWRRRIDVGGGRRKKMGVTERGLRRKRDKKRDAATFLLEEN